MLHLMWIFLFNLGFYGWKGGLGLVLFWGLFFVAVFLWGRYSNGIRK